MAKKKAKRKAVKRKPVRRVVRAKKRKTVRRKKPVKRKSVKRKPTRKAATRKPAKRKGRKRTVVSRQVVVERAIGRKRRRKRPAKRRVVMAGRSTRRRSVGKKGISTGLLVGLGVGAFALYLLTRPKTSSYPGSYQLPPLAQSNNQTRNNQANNIVQYAIAAGLAVDAITKIIDRLNKSNDEQLKNIYDHVNTTGQVSDIA